MPKYKLPLSYIIFGVTIDFSKYLKINFNTGMEFFIKKFTAFYKKNLSNF